MCSKIVDDIVNDDLSNEALELTLDVKRKLLAIEILLLNSEFEVALEAMERLEFLIMNAKLPDVIDDQVPIFYAVRFLIYCRVKLSKRIRNLKADLGIESVSEGQENDCNSIIDNTGTYDVLYFCTSARKYSILFNSTVQEFQGTKMLCIIADHVTSDHSDNNIYLLFGNERIPLSPNVLIYFEPLLNAFLFKVAIIPLEVIAVGFSLSPSELDIFCITLEDLKFDIYKAENVGPGEEGATEPEYAKTVSLCLVEGANYISSGLVNAASGLSTMISYATPKLIDVITPEPELNVPVGVVSGTQVAKTMCNTLANVTGFFATKVSTAVSTLGNMLAPHVKEQSTSFLKYCGMNDQSAEDYVSGSLEVAGGVVQGFRMIVEGLQNSGVILYSSVASNTIQIVKHKYGEPMSEVTGNTFDSLGSLMTASSNMKSLAPKRVIIKSIKETGKAAALQNCPGSSGVPPPLGSQYSVNR